LQIGNSRRDGKGFAVSCKVVEANVGVTTTSVKAPDVSPGTDAHIETLSLSLSLSVSLSLGLWHFSNARKYL
jgi:hypothetical protein